MSNVSFELKGAEELKKRIQLNNLAFKPVRQLFNEVGKVIKDNSRAVLDNLDKNDTGSLRSSIKYKRSTATVGRLPAGVRVFSTRNYAKFVHGDMDKNFSLTQPFDRTKPHYPPIRALTGWAERKGLNPYAVQRAIGIKGTPIVPFLKIGFENSDLEIEFALQTCAERIERQWKAGRKNL